MSENNITIGRVYPDRFSIIEEAIKSTNSPSLLGYHTPAYMNVLTSVLEDNPLYLSAYFNDNILGFVPIRWRNGKLGAVINSLPFFGPNGGPIITLSGKSYEHLVMERLAKELIKFADEIGAISIGCYTPFLHNNTSFETAFSPDRIVNRTTQYLNLEGFCGWPSHIRHKSLGRAKTKGVTTRIGTSEDIPRLFQIYYGHYGRKGIPLKPEAYFYQIIEKLCPLGVARFTVAEWENKVVACLITIQAGITISYNVPCCEEYAMTTQANSLLIDESVRMLLLSGYRFWNWEASSVDAVYRFKARWGSIEVPYKILLAYPKGLEAFSGMQPGDIATEYPYYFVVPFDDLTIQ